MHSQESVSSPRVRFYGTGTEFLVVRRERGWFQVSDPVTLERGRVFEKYLSPIAGSSLTQTATQSTAEPLPQKRLYQNQESGTDPDIERRYARDLGPSE